MADDGEAPQDPARDAPAAAPPAVAAPPGEAAATEGGEQGGEQGEGEAKPAEPALRMDQFRFDDEERPKKKKKAKPKPVKRPTRIWYETTITEMNRILSHLSKEVKSLDRINLDKIAELVNIKEQHVEVSEHLKRVFQKHRSTLATEEEYNLQIIKKSAVLEDESQNRIKELQNQYKQTHSQLIGEIEMLSTKLRTLREFQLNRDEMLSKFSSLETEFKESHRLYNDRLYRVQQKAVVERNKLDKNAKTRLQRVVDDFTESREIRNAAYTRRLLIENSALRRQYNALIPVNLKKEQTLRRLVERTAVVNGTHGIIRDLTTHLEKTLKRKNAIVERLEKFYQLYRLEVVRSSKYRRMYEAVKRHEARENAKYPDSEVVFEDLDAQATKLYEKHEALKQAELNYHHARAQYDQFVDSVKTSVFALCVVPNVSSHASETLEEYTAKRDSILKGLTELVIGCDRKLKSKPMFKAEYYRGYLGLLPFDFEMCQIFKCQGCEQESGKLPWVPSFCPYSDTKRNAKQQKEEEKQEDTDSGLMCLK